MISLQKAIRMALVLMVAWTGTASWAVEAERARLDALARQSMLAYQMTKSVCLVMLGAEAQIHADVAIEASNRFDSQMDAFVDGDETQGFAAERDEQLRADLVELRAYAKTMTSSARQIASGDVHGIPLTLLLQRHQSVSERVQTVWVTTAQKQTGTETLSPYLTTVQAAHRMNFKTQKVLRDICFIHLDIEKEATQDELSQTIIEFEELNALLKAGDEQKRYVPAPNIHIKLGYDKVASRWRTLKPMLEAAVAGEAMDLGDLQLASVMGDAIQKQMDDILRRYEKG